MSGGGTVRLAWDGFGLNLLFAFVSVPNRICQPFKYGGGLEFNAKYKL